MKTRAIKSLSLLSAICLCLTSQLFAQDASNGAIPLEAEAQRCTGVELKITEIPEPLTGFKCYPLTRGNAGKPGQGTSVELSAPTEVYMAVMDRGTPTLDPSWEKTDMTLGWEAHGPFTDVIYKKAAPTQSITMAPGTVVIDHTHTDYTKIPAEYVTKAQETLKVALGNSGHGLQLIAGMDGLYSAKGEKWAWSLDGSKGIEVRKNPLAKALYCGHSGRDQCPSLTWMRISKLTSWSGPGVEASAKPLIRIFQPI